MLINLIKSGNLMSVILYIVSSLMTIFLVLPLHECAHGFVANKLGDSTAKNQGRLTLNPLVHIDYLGAALLLLVGFGWAKPVPVNARRFKNPKAGMALTALAGPLSNLLAAVVAGLLYNLTRVILYKIAGTDIQYSLWFVYVTVFFSYLIMLNVGIAVFNFIPVPPLDGSKILMAFLPDKINFKIMQNQMIISIIFMIIVFTVGSYFLAPIEGVLSNIIIYVTALPFIWI